MTANAGTNATPRESQGTAQRLARATAGADPTSEGSSPAKTEFHN